MKEIIEFLEKQIIRCTEYNFPKEKSAYTHCLKEVKKQALTIPVVSNNEVAVCFCGKKAKYIYDFKELGKQICRCEEHKAN